MSWIPVTTCACPSPSRRTVACDGGPPPPHQICVAQPIPRSRPSRLRLAELLAARPAGELGGAVVAGEQLLARVRQPADLVDVGVVAAPQLERIHVERERELVDRLLERGRALHHPGRPERVLGAQVRLRRERQRAHVRAAVERAGRDQHGHRPAALTHRDDRIRVDRGERAVARRAEADRLPRRAAAAAVELLGVPVVDEPHGPAGDPRELGCGKRLEAGALLGAEARRRRTPSAPARRPCAARTPPASSSRAENIPWVETQAVSSVAVPRGDGGVRLERGLQLAGRVESELDRHLRGGERRLGVAPGIVGRLVDEALLVDGLLRVDDVREHLDVERERATPACAASSVSAATTAIGWPA